MKEHTVWCELPDGYQIIEKSRELPLSKAEAWLLTRRRQRYTAACRNGGRAVLIRHVIRCPYCGGELPAYPRFAAGLLEEWYGAIPAVPSREAVHTWAWDTPARQSGTLQLNEPCRAGGMYHCLRCGKWSAPFERPIRVCLRYSRKRLVLECITTDLSTLLQEPWFIQERITLPVPVREQLEFHFGRGHTCLRMLDMQGRQLAVRDITDSGTVTGSVLMRLLHDYPLLRRAVSRAFAASGAPLAVRSSQLRLQDLIEATRFIGFPRAFYAAIPYDLDTRRLDRSFRAAALRLHRSEWVEQAYRAVGLPGTKSVRRLFFQRPWLLFYPQEALWLWQATGSPSVFCRLLDCDRGCGRLAFLHQYPAVSDFFVDYGRVKGAAALRRSMEREEDTLLVTALCYAAMNPRLRLQEQQRWKRKEKQQRAFRTAAYSVPVAHILAESMEGTADGCTFRWLRSTNDCRAAGKALDNCLLDWSAGMPPVLLVSRQDSPVAAVEVRNGMITQAYLAHNRVLKNDYAVLCAVERWAQRCGLCWACDPWTQEDDEEDADELLF